MLPEGWKSVPFGALLGPRSGSARIPRAVMGEVLDHGDLPVIGQGQRRVEGYMNNPDLAFPEDHLPVLLFGPHSRIVKYVDETFIAGPNARLLWSKDETQADLRFMAYSIERIAPSLDTGRYADHFSLLQKESFLVPDLSEQRRIVAVLEQADRAVEVAARHVADAEAMLKATIENEVRAGDVTPLGSFLTPAKEVVEDIGWEHELPISVAMGGRGISAAPRWKAERSKTLQQRVYTGDFVVLRQGAAGGGFAVVPEDFDKAVLSTNFMRFTISNSVDVSWWRYRITSPSLAAACERAGMGSAQNFLTSRKLLAIEIAVPPLAEQQAIVARIEKVEAAVRAAEAHLERLRALRSSLLENLVSGRVRLPMPDATASEVTA